ncbi:hypothetical protein DSECCO2_591660 [anaerobic digester metagenome]
MKKWLVVIVLLLPFLATGQYKKAEKLFDKGVAAYKEKDYKAADSLFTLAVAIRPGYDVYYNLGLTKWQLGDTCLACSAWDKSRNKGYKEAYDLFKNHCIKTDSVVYKGGVYYSKVSVGKCAGDLKYTFYKYDKRGEKDTIVILRDDALLTERDVRNTSLPVETYIGGLAIIPEIAPEFPGGEEALMTFLRDNIRYPQIAREHNVQGTVYVSFVVRPDGKVTQVQVERGIGGGCDEESVRVVSLMPNWKPGMDKGKPVYSLFNIPIRYILH